MNLDLPVGSIIMFPLKEGVIIPFGYIECDGREIDEEEYTELFYNLSLNNDNKRIPKLEPINTAFGYKIIYIIKATSQDLDDAYVYGDAEFIIK